jgi:hypothetical protein
MEEGIEILIKLLKSKKKKKELTIFVPTIKFANLFVENAERELDLQDIKTFDPRVDLNIFVGADDNDKGKEKKDRT